MRLPRLTAGSIEVVGSQTQDSIRWLSVVCWLVVLHVLTIVVTAAGHPLEPLSTNELQAAVDILKKENRVATNMLYPLVALHEPPKERVLTWRPGEGLPREAAVTAYDLASHRTYEALVNLDNRQVTLWREMPGVEPLQTTAEYDASAELLRSNEVWQAALRRRGITNLALVDCGAIPAGVVPIRGVSGDVRWLRASPFYRAAERLTWEPLEGLSAIIDMSNRKVVRVIDREVFPRSASSMDLFDPAVRGERAKLKPLVVTQPDGPSFTLQDHAISWDRWRFRYSFHPREGLVLHQIGWEDAPGHVRPVLYRASVADLLVPYSDPDEDWSWRAYFDESDYGLGYFAASLVPGVTTVSYATLLSEPMPDQTGGADLARDLVDLYERDAGMLWAHYDSASKASVGARARELVIGYLTTVGNYDYRFQWSFRQDGSIEFHVYLTGVMQLKGTQAKTCEACASLANPGSATLKGEQAHGVVVADHLLAPHHQHLFNLRLDFDVDGVNNSVKEMNLSTDPPGSGNRFGNAFSLQQTVFARERDAVRDLNPLSHRMWAVFNPNSISPLGHPAAYLIDPGMNTVPFLAKDSPARQRAGFTEHHFFVTQYRSTERYAAGDYPVTKGRPNNLATWTHDNESILNKDVVLWYTVGVTHVARPEDFPVMSSAHASVRFVPKAFSTRNPAFDVPVAPATAQLK